MHVPQYSHSRIIYNNLAYGIHLGKCSSTDGWIKKLLYVYNYTYIYFLAIKNEQTRRCREQTSDYQ